MMNRCRTTYFRMVAPFIGLAAVSVFMLAGTADPLEQGFKHPPDSARPRVWWHWMNGNISKEGIKLDLEWMRRVGIAGFQNFDAALATPQVVDHRLAYMTPEWKEAFKYAISVADRLGMEIAIAGSPGWSETGGPWVPASHGMKKYVWSETFVEGGKPFRGILARPPTNTGAFQNMGVRDLSLSEGAPTPPEFYADSAVIAYRRPVTDLSLDALHTRITASATSVNTALLVDGDLEKTTKIPISPTGDPAWVQFEFPTPQVVRAIGLASVDADVLTAMVTGQSNPERTIEASDDGCNFRTIAKFPDFSAPQNTVSFAPVRAKFFRVVFRPGAPPAGPLWLGGLDPASFGLVAGSGLMNYEVAEIALHPGTRVNLFEAKAAFSAVHNLGEFATQSVSLTDIIAKPDIVDLTSRLRSDGSLDWTPPAGDWVVLRFGYSLLGITNHPATAEATGLEVDKMNRGYVKDYVNKYLDSYRDAVGPDYLGKRGIRFVITDSWEAGSQNWTDDMITQFKRRRGYDPIPWMPVLTGRVVESAESSDRFLWDFRKTIADLIADEHYGQVQESLKARGIGHYGESHEVGRALVADGMEIKKLNDIPMSAMWIQPPGENREDLGFNADDRESASVAHIYGQNIAAAESLTAAQAPWGWSPATLKPTADLELLNGINRFVIHESAHQPLLDKAPGLTLGPFGQWFNRNETWAEQAGPWIDYLARSSYMLQQGRFAADMIYFYGEDSNLTAIFQNKAPDVPPGYGFDYVNADALMHELSVAGGKLTTRSGMSYRLLYLDPYSKHMSLPVLRAIHHLVQQGAVVAGENPTDSPSLADDPSEFKKLKDELFGDGAGVRSFGKGKVFAGQRPEEVLRALNIAPDFDHRKSSPQTRVLFVHRKLLDGDIYFLNNRNEHGEDIDASFRVSGRIPELWYAETGKSERTSYRIADGRTIVPVHFDPWGSVFVVFRKPVQVQSVSLPKPVNTQLATIEGPWNVNFQSGRGAPASVMLDRLISWTDSADAGVRYFSGTATYSKTVQATPDFFKPGAKLWIDLGSVMNLAEVIINGKSLGVAWHAPFQIEVTGVLEPGKNQIEVKVTNAWVNRMIGDQQPDAATKYTFTVVKPYKVDSPLLPSGLLGPVRIFSQASQ
jgi:hypothetical protein